jgi:hypothetical protein
LTPAEQLERRRQGLCFNCEEPFVWGHVCKCLFYLETVDYVDDPEHPTADDDGTALPEDSTTAV